MDQVAYINTGAEALEKFYAGLHEHRKNVLDAGLQVGGIPYADLARHDLSKYSEEEFPYYARHFFGDSGDPEGFTRAWLHHLQHNDHHYQHWCLPEHVSPAVSNPGASALKDASPSNREGVGARYAHKYLAMPEVRIREMIADWIGASVTYTGSPDLAGWLAINLSKVVQQMHPETAKRTLELLKGLGYETPPYEVLLKTPAPVRAIDPDVVYQKLSSLLPLLKQPIIIPDHEINDIKEESDETASTQEEGDREDREAGAQEGEASDDGTEDIESGSRGVDWLGSDGSSARSNAYLPEAIVSDDAGVRGGAVSGTPASDAAGADNGS